MIYCYTFKELLNAIEANIATELHFIPFIIKKYKVKILAEALKSNTSLRVLNLDGNQITDAGGQYLLEALKVNNFLQVLNPIHGTITDYEARDLAEPLRIKKAVQCLLTKNPINTYNGTGARLPAEAFTHKSFWRALDAYDNKIKLETIKKIKLKTTFNKHLYISTKYFINELFDQYKKAKDVKLSDIANKFWLINEVYYNSAKQFENTSKYAFTSISKVKLLEFFIKHPSPAQFISKVSQLALDNFTVIFQDFTNYIKNNYISGFFYLNRVCKLFINKDDSIAEQSAPKDINCNNNSQIEKVSNKNLYSILPPEILYKIIELVIFGGGINHSAPAIQGVSQVKPDDSQGKPADSMNNAGDAMDNAGEGD